MLVKVYGAALLGIDAIPIRIEVNMDPGIAYHLVGLPDSAIKESGYRISAALKNSGFRMPGKRITINLAPADLRKEGSAYDLPMAIGILVASKQIESHSYDKFLMMGELSLDGALRSVRGVLPIALLAREKGFEGLILPAVNAREASVVEGIRVYGAGNIKEVVSFIKDGKGLVEEGRHAFFEQDEILGDHLPDFEEVKGQETVKRCMEIAAAGGHNVLMIGPPGSGKTMLARRLPSILPPMTPQEALETTKIHSVAGKIGENRSILVRRPFRSPHHSSSAAALVGGGAYPLPGDISLAHNGVLFLDELPEFKRSALEVMRQPLEDRQVTISRARFTITYPSSFMLVASMNPSPSGYFIESDSSRSSAYEMKRYMSRISGPLLDRIDLHIEVRPVPFEELSSRGGGQPSQVIRARVTAARLLQAHRFQHRSHIHCNAQMTVKLIRRFCQISAEAQQLLKHAMKNLNLSARAYDRILKVSRTIADLSQCDRIRTEHVAEAIQYRSLDKEGFLG